MKDESISNFLKNLGEKSATPGGGTVAGLNGAIAAAQLKMVCEFSEDKTVNDKAAQLEDIVFQFVQYAEDDSKAYDSVRNAYSSKDQDKIQVALGEAALPQGQIAEACIDLIEFIRPNLDKFNQNLISDVVVSLANIEAAIRSAKATLMINYKSMTDSEVKDTVRTQISTCDDLLDAVDKTYKEIGA